MSASTASLIQPLTITGVSQFSSDLQSILTRAVQLASLPVQQLQNEQSDLQQEQSLMSNLGTAVSSMTSSVTALGQLGASGGLVANSSDSSAATATVTGATAPATYSITDISSVASAASESSINSYTASQAVSNSPTLQMQLTVGTTNYPIQLTSATNNLNGLSSAINALNAGVTASVITTSSGDYLSVSAQNTGATTLQLEDDPNGTSPTQILTSNNQGSDAKFYLNGAPVDEPSNTINNVVSGVTFQINGTTTTTTNGTTSPGQPVTISLAPDPTQLSSALQTLVTNYNAVQNQLTAQTGSDAGLLVGNSIIGQTREAMMNLVSYYSTSGSIHSLADLGISVDQTGQMSFDPTALDSFSSSQLSDAFSFLGSSTTGLGALQSQFTAISDPISGTIQVQENDYTSQNQHLTDQITTMSDSVNLMQTNLQSQLEAADASIAALESQQSVLTSSIQALNYTTYGQQILSSQGV